MIIEFVKVFKEEDLKDGYGADYFDKVLEVTLSHFKTLKLNYWFKLTGNKKILKKFKIMRQFSTELKTEVENVIKTASEHNGITVKIEEKNSIKKEVKIELIKIELK